MTTQVRHLKRRDPEWDATTYDAGYELRRLGLDIDGNAEALTSATRWGEELARPRLHDR